MSRSRPIGNVRRNPASRTNARAIADRTGQDVCDSGQLGGDPCYMLLELNRRRGLGRTFQVRAQLTQGSRINIGTRTGELVYRAGESVAIAASVAILNLGQQLTAADEIAFHQVRCEVSVSASDFVQRRQVNRRGTGGGQLWQNFLQPLQFGQAACWR